MLFFFGNREKMGNEYRPSTLLEYQTTDSIPDTIFTRNCHARAKKQYVRFYIVSTFVDIGFYSILCTCFYDAKKQQ